jgi:plastocyanin
MQTAHVGFQFEDIIDATFGRVAYYTLQAGANSAQIIRVNAGSQIVFVNDDATNPHTASGLGTSGFPATFTNTSGTTQSGSTIDGSTSWSTGTLNPGQRSQVFTIPAPGMYFFGCAFHYTSNTMRDVVIAT